MTRLLIATAVVLFTICQSRVLAHGVRYSVSEGATVVTATYDDGNSMAFCDVAVFAPGGNEETYQEGTSDRNGCFAFVPDTNGTWRVTVDDGMGHLVEVEIKIDSGGRQISDAEHHSDRLGGAVIGISVIFGAFGLYAMLTGAVGSARRAKKREHES